MANILNSDKNGLKLFDNGVIINKSLAKWKNARVGTTPSGNAFISPQTMIDSTGAERRVIDL